MKKILMAFMLLITLTACANTNQESNINDDGSYVLTSDGIKSDFTDKDNQKIIWYIDYTCSDCKRVHLESNNYVKEIIKEGKAEIKYYPLGFLDKYISNKYSTRSAVWSLGVAEFLPEYLDDFINHIYNEEMEIEERNEKYFESVLRGLKVGEQDIKKVKNNLTRYEEMVSKSTEKFINSEELKNMTPDKEVFVPFIIIDGKVLDGESEDVENDIIGPMSQVIGDVEIGNCGKDEDSLNCVPGQEEKENK